MTTQTEVTAEGKEDVLNLTKEDSARIIAILSKAVKDHNIILDELSRALLQITQPTEESRNALKGLGIALEEGKVAGCLLAGKVYTDEPH